jgi:putative membrane protein
MTELFAFLHHLAAFTLVASLAVEFVLLRHELTLAGARKLQLADLVYGASAAIVLVIGFLRVIYFEKGTAYYFHSAPFIAKLSLFVIIALISIYPTVEFQSWKKSLKQGQVPTLSARKAKSIRSLIHLQLAAIVIIILCAVLMARGVGSFG